MNNHVVFLLDSSGSMNGIRFSIIELFNEQVSKLNPKALVTYATFGTKSKPIVHFSTQPADKIKTINSENYIPDGMTPMDDCIGNVVTSINTLKSPEDTVLVVILSDGQENHSGQWQTKEDKWKHYLTSEIKELITSLESTEKWTFVFAGSNQTAEYINTNYGIQMGNIKIIPFSRENIEFTSYSMHTSTSDYFSNNCRGVNNFWIS